MATKAQIFFPALSGLRFDGVTLASGRLFFYEPGTTTQRAVYANRGKTVLATTYSEAADGSGPFYVRLDADGQTEVFLDGVYDIVVKSSTSVTKATWEGYEGSSLSSDAAAAPIVVDTTAANVTKTLPTDSAFVRYVKSTADANIVDFTTSDGSTIAESTFTLTVQYSPVSFAKTGTVWYRMAG